MQIKFDEIKEKIDGYLKDISKEQLEQDLLDSGLERYSSDEFNFLDKMKSVPESESRKEIILEEGGDDSYPFFKVIAVLGTLGSLGSGNRAGYFRIVGMNSSANGASNENLKKKTFTNTSSFYGSHNYENQPGIQKNYCG